MSNPWDFPEGLSLKNVEPLVVPPLPASSWVHLQREEAI